MPRKAAPAKRQKDRAGTVIGAQGQPLSAYPGWDAEEGVFRLDCSITDLEERYRRIAEDAESGDAVETAESNGEEPDSRAPSTLAPSRSIST